MAFAPAARHDHCSHRHIPQRLVEDETDFGFEKYNTSYMTLSGPKNRTVYVSATHGWVSCYGSVEATSGSIHEWKVSYDKKQTHAMIGIKHTVVDGDVNNAAYSRASAYMLYDNGCNYSNGNQRTNMNMAYTQGDVITVTLDLSNEENGILTFQKNDGAPAMAWNDLPCEKIYRLAVDIHSGANTLTILSHRTNSGFPSLDSSAVALEKTLQQLNALIEQNGLNDIDPKDLGALQTEFLNGRRRLNVVIDGVTRACDIVENQFKSALHVDVRNWKNWTDFNAITWIRSLEDGRFVPYCDRLYEVFREQRIAGAELGMLNRSDLQSFGMINFRDRHDLEVHFQQLTQTKK